MATQASHQLLTEAADERAPDSLARDHLSVGSKNLLAQNLLSMRKRPLGPHGQPHAGYHNNSRLKDFHCLRSLVGSDTVGLYTSFAVVCAVVGSVIVVPRKGDPELAISNIAHRRQQVTHISQSPDKDAGDRRVRRPSRVSVRCDGGSLRHRLCKAQLVCRDSGWNFVKRAFDVCFGEPLLK